MDDDISIYYSLGNGVLVIDQFYLEAIKAIGGVYGKC